MGGKWIYFVKCAYYVLSLVNVEANEAGRSMVFPRQKRRLRNDGGGKKKGKKEERNIHAVSSPPVLLAG